MNGSLHLWLIPLLPFAGFLFNGLLGRHLPKWMVTIVALLAPLAAFGVVLNAAWILSSAQPHLLPYIETCPLSWISIGTLHVDFSLVLDQLSMVMLLVVTGVGFLIHIYSVGYMGDEEGYARYFSYLNLFLFFMTVLVLAGNALFMFVGWEGVGLASYLLIGFYFHKKSAADAGKKAFIVNRIGDFGFLIGMFLLLANFGTLTFTEIATKLGQDPGWQGGVVTVIALCLLLAARRHGRPDAGLCSHPCCHHGHCRRLHDCPDACAVRPLPLCARCCCLCGRGHGALCSHHRPRPD
jgi:NADH-quinone oxidoreductase subunit L